MFVGLIRKWTQRWLRADVTRVPS